MRNLVMAVISMFCLTTTAQNVILDKEGNKIELVEKVTVVWKVYDREKNYYGSFDNNSYHIYSNDFPVGSTVRMTTSENKSVEVEVIGRQFRLTCVSDKVFKTLKSKKDKYVIKNVKMELVSVVGGRVISEERYLKELKDISENLQKDLEAKQLEHLRIKTYNDSISLNIKSKQEKLKSLENELKPLSDKLLERDYTLRLIQDVNVKLSNHTYNRAGSSLQDLKKYKLRYEAELLTLNNTINKQEPKRLKLIKQVIELENNIKDLTASIKDLADLDLAQLKCYPNPVVGTELTVAYKEPIRTIEVYNLSGKRVKVQQFDSSEVRINISTLSSGTYMMKVQTETGSQIIKVVKK